MMIKNKVKNFSSIFLKFIKENPVLTYFVIVSLIGGIFLRLFTTGTFSLRAVLFDLGIVLLLGSFSLLVKKKNQNRYFWIVTFILVACCTINSTYYTYYSSFVSVSLLATSVFVKDVGDAILGIVIRPVDLIYLLEFLGLYIVIKKNKKKKETKNSEENVKNNFFKGIIISVLVIGFGSALPPYNSFSRLFKLWNRVSVVNNFGVYVYQIDDIIQSLKPTFNNIFGYDNALKDVKEYYDENETIPSINDYTGIFEGKNVIVIHAESLQTFTLGLSFNNSEVAPNLNKLANEGIYFNNFYAQVGVGTSSDSEFTFATSLLPANSGTVFVNYANNKFETLQSMLNNKGYYVFSMHGNVGDFWNRDTMHLNMGYDKFYSKSSFVIDEEYGLGLSDKSFFRQAVPMIQDIKENVGEPYYGTLITLTNHTPWKEASIYSDYDLSMTVEIDGEEIVRSYLEDTTMGKYLKSVNYMDQAIGQFIQDMDEAGLLDNTVIVIYGDHDARLGKKQFEYMYNYDPETDKLREEDDPLFVEFNDYDYELSRKVPFIIWTKDMEEGKVIDTPMGMIDASVTFGNMLGVYNKYALGKDVMSISKSEGIVVYKDGSYITDKIYYNAKYNEAYAISNGIISDDYIDKNSKYADKLISVSYNIITYDLIRELEKSAT